VLTVVIIEIKEYITQCGSETENNATRNVRVGYRGGERQMIRGQPGERANVTFRLRILL